MSAHRTTIARAGSRSTGDRRRRPVGVVFRGGRLLLMVALLVAVAVAPATATTQTMVDPVDQFEVLGVRADESAEVLFAAQDRLMTQLLTDDDIVVRVDGEATPTQLQRLSATDLDLAVVIDTTVSLEALRAIQGAVVQLALELPRGATMRIATAEGEVAPPAAVPGPAIAQIRQLTSGVRDDLQLGVTRATAELDRTERDRTALLVIGRDLGRRLQPIDDQPFSRLVHVVDITAAESPVELLGSRVAGRVITVEDVDAMLSATDEMSHDVRNLYHVKVDLPDRDAQTLTLQIPAADSTAPTRTVALDPDRIQPLEPGPQAVSADAGGGPADEGAATPSAGVSLPDVSRPEAVAATIAAAALVVLSLLWQVVRQRRNRPRPLHRRQRSAASAAPTPPTSDAQSAPDTTDAPGPHDADDGAFRTHAGGSDREVWTVQDPGGHRAWSNGGAESVARPIAKPNPQTREALAHAHLGLRRLALASRAVAAAVPDDLFSLAEARASVALSRQDLDLEEVLTGALSEEEDADIDLVQRTATALSIAWQHTDSPSSAPPPVVEIDAVLSRVTVGRSRHAAQRPVVPVRALNPLIAIGLEHLVLANQPDRDSQLVARAVTAVDVMRAARLARPVLALSPCLLDDRARYRASLEADLTDTEQRDRWLEFLCRCIARGATQSVDRLAKLDRLRTRYCQRTTDARALPLIDLLLSQPIIDAALVASRLRIPRETAEELVSTATAAGWLRPFAARPDTWIADQVLSLFTSTPRGPCGEERSSMPEAHDRRSSPAL